MRRCVAVSALGVVAIASPLVPATLLAASLRAKRALDVLAPLQFAALLGGAVLAMSATGGSAPIAAVATVLLAIGGLFTTVLRKDSAARRAIYSFDWEKFERDLHFYAIVADLR
jgi:hypothetical protein